MAKQVTLKYATSVVQVDPKYLSDTGRRMVAANQQMVGSGLANRRRAFIKPGSKKNGHS